MNRRPKKNSGLYGIWTHDLCDTSALLYPLRPSLPLPTHAFYSLLHGFIWNQHDDQHPVGFLAHLVEQCTGIAEVIGSYPVQAWIFFQAFFHYCLSSVHNCEDCFHIHIYVSANIFFQHHLRANNFFLFFSQSSFYLC